MLRFLVLLRSLRHDLVLLFFAMLRRDTPPAVKFLFPLTLLYLISPVDLVPDTVPLLGVVDDMIVLPAATSLLVRMLPAQARAEGERSAAHYGTLVLAAASIVLVLWLVLIVWALYKVFS